MKYEIRGAESSGIPVDNVVKIDDDGSETFIPVDERNSDYQTYLAWLEQNSV